MNLKVKGFSVLLFVLINSLLNRVLSFPTSSGDCNLVEQTRDKTSQLIEVIGAREVHVLANLDFIAFIDTFAKDDHRHTFFPIGTFANANGWVGMVIVVPPFAKGQQRDPPVVPGIVVGGEPASAHMRVAELTIQVACRLKVT